MPSIRRAAIVPHSCEQMYALVNDIEAYPSFLPWCRRAEVRDRTERELTASLEIARGPVAKTFTTRNTLQPGRRIDMELVSGPFRRLRGAWTFDQHAGGLCSVEFSLEFDYASRLVALTLGPLFEHAADRLVQAFCERARTRLG